MATTRTNQRNMQAPRLHVSLVRPSRCHRNSRKATQKKLARLMMGPAYRRVASRDAVFERPDASVNTLPGNEAIAHAGRSKKRRHRIATFGDARQGGVIAL